MSKGKSIQFEEDYEYVTYQYLGIDAQKFYDGKFVGGEIQGNLLEDCQNRYDIELSRVRFLVERISGGTVLDVGCGSGPYGSTLKACCPIQRLVGLDMDEACVEIARETYDDVKLFEIEQSLPFPDNSFDTVFSVDVFGHIEFRYKNHLIEEIKRITKPGGTSLHIIESGELDYGQIDPGDPTDPLLKYVKMEGHIGIEPAARIKKRWSSYFSEVTVENAFVYPLYPLATYIADGSFFEEDFCKLLREFSDEQKKAAQICLGYVTDYLKKMVKGVEPDYLMPLTEDKMANDSPVSELIAKIFRKHSGLVYLSCKKEG